MPNTNSTDKPSNLLEISGNVTSHRPIDHQGALLVNGSVESGSYITARDNIEICGEVNQSKIRSTNGSILVRGGVRGVTTQIQAGKDIEAGFVFNATLKAGQNIRINEIAADARIVARNSVYLEIGIGLPREGAIEGGEIEAGMEIVANSIGNENKVATIVKLTNFKQMDSYAVLLILDQEMEDIKKQMADLERFIEIIRLLGKSVVTLPINKKQELALKVQKFNELQGRLSSMQSEKDQIIRENQDIDELDRTILAKNMIFEGVYAYIDKVKLYVQENFKNVILYKKGIIIIGDFDEFMKRKKYA